MKEFKRLKSAKRFKIELILLMIFIFVFSSAEVLAHLNFHNDQKPTILIVLTVVFLIVVVMFPMMIYDFKNCTCGDICFTLSEDGQQFTFYTTKNEAVEVKRSEIKKFHRFLSSSYDFTKSHFIIYYKLGNSEKLLRVKIGIPENYTEAKMLFKTIVLENKNKK